MSDAVGAERIPAFVNLRGGSASAAREAIAADARFALHALEPDALTDAITASVRQGAPRILVSGGDGTIASAARVVAGTETALAVLPGGTLNHFARTLGLPADDAAACLDVAATGEVRPVDAATVNDVLFLNTSSVGAYVSFVHTRERLEGYHLGYHLSTALAAVWTWARLRGYRVRVRVGARAGDPERTYASPLVFVAVGERSFTPPEVGGRVPNGERALHAMVVREVSPWRVVTLALRMASQGIESVARTPSLDVALVPACEVDLPRRRGRVALDGELEPLDAPLCYRYQKDALLAVHGHGR